MVAFNSMAVAALTLASPAFAICQYGTHLFPRQAKVPVGTFGYTGLNGPLNWFGLNKTANVACATGKHQSPINLNTSIPTINGLDVTFTVENRRSGAIIENLGTTLEVPSNGSFAFHGKHYSLAQFHFHTPSEHYFDLVYYPMEMHFVFSAADKSTAVVAFPIELGPENPLFVSLFYNVEIIKTPGDTTYTEPLNFDALMDHLIYNRIYTYSGSLTTPPCTEGVTWFVSNNPLQIDQFTYHTVKSVIGHNARYIQNNIGGINLLQNAANELK